MKFIFTIFILTILLSCKKSVDSNLSPTPTPAPSVESCQSSPIDQGSRMLGYDIVDITETVTFNDNIIKGKSMGMGFFPLHLHWNSIETTPNNFTE